jgi:hypothetical protein
MKTWLSEMLRREADNRTYWLGRGTCLYTVPGGKCALLDLLSGVIAELHIIVVGGFSLR